MVLDGAVKAPSLLRFLARLGRDAAQKVFLILDRLPVHRSAKVRAWLAGREAEIEVFYLPGYSPELVWGLRCQAEKCWSVAYPSW
jgi:hypothetical protein